jgi:hypothetical protein
MEKLVTLESQSKPLLYRAVRRFVITVRTLAIQQILAICSRFSRRPVIGDAPVVVSLTTFGKRLETVHLTIESIARGTVRPSKIILWVDPNTRIDQLPTQLLALIDRGLVIESSPKMYGPHTKYYPYVSSTETFDAALVTADDDILYPRSWLEGLIHAASKSNNQDIVCHQSHLVRTFGDSIAPYMSWFVNSSGHVAPHTFATGVMGVWYPPEFQARLKQAGDRFMVICPNADDVWLHVQALRHGFTVRQVNATPANYPMRIGSQTTSLASSNAFLGGNDSQISQTYTSADADKLRRHHTTLN